MIGEVLQDTYRIERLIGQGGMGAVYEASHLRLAQRFAVKVLSQSVADNPDALARFRREAEITSSLGHQHILLVIDFNHTSRGSPYIVMEMLQGEDLAARILRATRLDLAQAASIFRQAASALEAAHQKRVIHRDLKPKNIFLCRRGERNDFVKVVDFGISKVLGSQSMVTKTNSLLGTPAYMSPEQAEERAAETDLRTDVYSMGAIVFEMLTGRPPFTAQMVPSLLYKIVHEPTPMLRSVRSDIPESVDSVVQKAMAKDSAQRYASMKAFWREFAASLADEDVEFYEPTEDRQTDWLSMTTPPVAPPPLPVSLMETRPQRVPDVTTIPAKGTISTLSGSNGEVLPSLKTRRSSKKLLAVAAALAVGLAGITVLLLSMGKSPQAAKQEPRRAAAAPKLATPPVPPDPTTHAVVVVARGPRAVCEARVGDAPAQTQFTPCRFADIPPGAQLTLKIARRGYRALNEQWKVDADRTLTVEVVRTKRRIVLAEPAQTGVAEKLPRAPDAAPSAAEPVSDPSSAGRTRSPHKKKRRRRTRIGDGIMDL